MGRKILTHLLGACAIAAAATLGAGARAESNAGAYLAARVAAADSDYVAAARYYSEALRRDPGNAELVDHALVSHVAIGQTRDAVPIARLARAARSDSKLVAMVGFADAGREGDWDRLLANLEAGASAGPLMDGLVRGWAELGQGNQKGAFAAFEQTAQQPGLRSLALHQLALALSIAGEDARAAEILALSPQDGLRQTRRGVILQAEVLGRIGKFNEAIALLDTSFSTLDPGLVRLREALSSGTVPRSAIANDAAAGLAEAFFVTGAAIGGQADDTVTLMFFRLARYLDTKHVEAQLRSGTLLDRMGRYDLAMATFGQVPDDDPAYRVAALGLAQAMRKSGAVAGAAGLLEDLSLRFETPDIRKIQGDVLRELGRYAEARDAYSRSLELTGATVANRWFIYYSRGITYEKLGEWDLAEADFRAALVLEPDQPQVLNYLGYGLAEQNIKLDESLALLRRAVAASPDSGHILDSLGWVLYRLGRYDESIEYLERAAELDSTHPVIIDHLGDAYWRVGRRTEARFQWRRALSFGPEDTQQTAISAKLDRGLEAAQSMEIDEATLQVAHGDRP